MNKKLIKNQIIKTVRDLRRAYDLANKCSQNAISQRSISDFKLAHKYIKASVALFLGAVETDNNIH